MRGPGAHPPKACSGRSPDFTASSPMSALVGASLMPLLMRSAICGHAHPLNYANVCAMYASERLQLQVRASQQVSQPNACVTGSRAQPPPVRTGAPLAGQHTADPEH